jgi:hypothetical protein
MEVIIVRCDRGVCDVLARCTSHEMKLFYIQSRVSKQSSASCNWFAAVERGTGFACFAPLHARVKNMSVNHAD